MDRGQHLIFFKGKNYIHFPKDFVLPLCYTSFSEGDDGRGSSIWLAPDHELRRRGLNCQPGKKKGKGEEEEEGKLQGSSADKQGKKSSFFSFFQLTMFSNFRTAHVANVQDSTKIKKEQEHFPVFRPRRGATTVDLPFAVRQRPLLFPGKKGG